MKKISTAIALLGIVSGSALAQTSNSSITIYGVVDAGITRETGGPAGNVTNLGSGMASGARLGFKGKEDLGGGTTAFFLIENGFNVDTGVTGQGGLLFGRQAFVGLKSTAGTLTLGRQYSPYYRIVRDVADPFEVGYAGTASNLMATNTRVDNMAEYVSPNVYGFTADLATGFGEVAGDSARNRVFSASLTYASGPLTVAGAWHQKQNPTATDHARNSILSVKYNAGFAEGVVSYASNKGLAGADSNDIIAGVSFPALAGKVFGSYIRHDDKRAINRDASQWALGYSYLLSKRTDLYAAYARIDNRNGATFTVGNATTDGTGHTGTNIGIRHIF